LMLACDLAREVAAPAQLGLLAHDVLHRAQAQGWGQEGFPVATKILEAMAGVELRAAPAADTTGYQAVTRGGPRSEPSSLIDGKIPGKTRSRGPLRADSRAQGIAMKAKPKRIP